MIALAPSLSTHKFATLPEALRLDGVSSEWADNQPGVGQIHSLLEGPCFTPDGSFYCVDVAHGRIFEIEQGTFRVAADYDGQPNGLCAHADGRIFVADHKNGILTYSPGDGRIEEIVQNFDGLPFKGVNDLTFSNNGDLYFTDQGLTGLHDPSGRVFRLHANGELTLLLDNVPSPNGLVLSRDQTELYVAVTRDNAIWRLPLTSDGGTTKVGRFIQMSGGIGPDGMAIDCEGNLFVAHIGMGCVWMFSPRGEPLLRIESCAGSKVTNLAFGGKDNRTLFITEAESGSILAADLNAPGEILFSHRQ